MNAREGYPEGIPETWLKLVRQLAPTSALAARLNHEVKNSLAGVLAGLQVLEKGAGLSQDDKYVVSLLVEEIRRLDRNLWVLLESVRIDAVSFHPVSVESLLTGCVASLDRAIQHGGVVVRIISGADCLQLTVDQRAMERALAHLVRNAVEASPNGGEVRLGWGGLEAERKSSLFPGVEGEVIVIYGEDDGAGLPPDLPVEKLFEPLFATSGSRMGMGLAVARCLVELHGGVLQIHSLQRGGTRFEVFMPSADVPVCWDAPAREICALPPCDRHCDACEARSELPHAACWAVKGSSHRERDGSWPRKCASCALFRAHNLPLALACGALGKDENHGWDGSDRR